MSYLKVELDPRLRAIDAELAALDSLPPGPNQLSLHLRDIRTRLHALDAGGLMQNVTLRNLLRMTETRLSVLSEGSSPYVAKAVHFDGATTFNRGGNLTGAGNPDTFLTSLWLNFPSITNRYIFGTPDNGNFTLQLNGVAGSTRVDTYDSNFGHDNIQTFSSWVAGVWSHILIAFDKSDQSKCWVLVNGVDQTNIVQFGMTGSIDLLDESSFFVGSDAPTHGRVTGDFADLYLAFGQWLDLTNPTNIAKFSVDGKPVNLGTDGSKPTGTSPTIFFSGDASTFGQPNLGTGGAFTLTGTLTNAGTSPSD